jgi:hypothetical protein
MTRAPLLRLGGADVGSCFTVLGVDPDDRDADLDADPEERDAIRRGIHELPQRRDRVGGCGGGIPTTTALFRLQVGATRRAGTFLGVSHVFVSSGLPERAPGEGRGWPGLSGWMKAQIRATLLGETLSVEHHFGA